MSSKISLTRPVHKTAKSLTELKQDSPLKNSSNEVISEMQEVIFLSNAEIVSVMISEMDTETFKSWKEVKYEDLALGLHSTGRAIRNHYHLWNPENPHSAEIHPDIRSMAIMQEVWRRVHMH